MPLYEYQCKKCKHKFEKIQKFSDPPVKKCPECGGPVEQLIHAPAVQFKGSGWYVTDYGGKTQAKDTGSAAKKDDAQGSSKEKSDTEAKTKPSKTESKKASKDS